MINRMNRVNGRLEEDTSPLASAVRYDADQIRSEDEKAQARANMGAISEAQLADTKADLEEQIENISGISDPEAVSQMVEDVAKHETDISALKSSTSSIEKLGLINILKDVSFEKGSIDSSSGQDTATSTRIRSAMIDVSDCAKIVLVPNSGYKVTYQTYDKNQGFLPGTDLGAYYVKTKGKWLSDETTIHLIPRISFIRILIAYTDDSSSISVNDVYNVSVFSDYPIRKNSILNERNNNILLGSTVNITDWDQGIPNPATPTINEGTTRIFSTVIKDFPDYLESVTMEPTPGYQTAYYLYNSNFELLVANFWATKKITFKIPSDAVYLFIGLSKQDSSSILPSEGVNVQIKYNLDSSKVPSYFRTNVEESIASIKSNMVSCGLNGDSFAFITDLHWSVNSKNSPALLQKIIENTNIRNTICGGDLIDNGTKSNMVNMISDCINSFKENEPFYVLLGNHDTNAISTTAENQLSKNEAYALIQKQTDFSMNYGQPCYFYFDNPTTKTRYICLDTGLEGTALDNDQQSWLESSLNSMPSGFHALIFAHIIYQTTTTWHIGLQPSELERTPFMNAVCTILDSFNANNNDKKVEAIFGGHVHIDCDFSSPNGIPIVLTDTDSTRTYTTTDGTTANSTTGTINEQCFDVVTIDYSNEQIKCTRIGRGNNRVISY